MSYKIKPQEWQCPQCLEPVGVFGNFLSKIFGTRLHGCDFSNVVGNPDKEVEYEPLDDTPAPIYWPGVIDHYIELINEKRKSLDEELVSKPFKLELNVVRHRRGLALEANSQSYFLDHIVYASMEHETFDAITRILENRKMLTQSMPVMGIKLDPHNPQFPPEWNSYVYATISNLKFHLANGTYISFICPYHISGKVLEAANRLLRNGASQVVEHIPEKTDDTAGLSDHDSAPSVDSGQ